MIWSDDGGGKEKVRSSGGRSFQRRGAVTDINTIILLNIQTVSFVQIDKKFRFA